MVRQSRLWLCLGVVAATVAGIAIWKMQSGLCRELTGTIQNSGNYCLSRDLTAQQGILIKADNVTVDLGRRCLIGPGSAQNTAAGFEIEAQRKNITLKNGCVMGFMYGVKSEPGSGHVLIENVAFKQNTFRAAMVEADDVRITNSSVDGVGGTSVFEDASTMGLDLRGKRNTVSETQVNEVYPVGSGDSVGIAIRGEGGSLLNNTVRNSKRSQWGRIYGISGLKDTKAVGNICIHQTYGFSGLAEDGNTVSEEDCASDSKSCPDDIEAALRALDIHDVNDGRRLFRVGRAYHKAKDYPKAAIYYLAAGRKGMAEGNRIVERHLKFGYITADDKAVAERESRRLTTR
jgi:hypothetical protein